MNPVDRQTLARKFDYLRSQLDTLEPYRVLPPDVLLGTIEKRLTVERLLELSIQSVIDCSRMLVTMEQWRAMGDDRDALLLLAEHGVLSPTLAERLLAAKGFRNVLVHDYVEIDPDLLIANLHDGVPDLWEFAKHLAKTIA